jgi:hypothetical protein
VNYISTLQVKEIDGGWRCRIEWVGEFTPTTVSDGEALSLFDGIYEGGLQALRDHPAVNLAT